MIHTSNRKAEMSMGKLTDDEIISHMLVGDTNELLARVKRELTYIKRSPVEYFRFSLSMGWVIEHYRSENATHLREDALRITKEALRVVEL